MLQLLFSSLPRDAETHPWRLWAGPLLLLVALGLFIYPDFGVGVDEDTETAMVLRDYSLITDHYLQGDFNAYYSFPDNTLPLYGTVLNYAAYPFQWVANGGSSFNIINSVPGYKAKHLITFLFSLLAYIGIASALKDLTGSRYSMLLAVLTLALQPFFFGISFFFPKDPTFAALMTMASVAIAHASARMVSAPGAQATRRAVLVAALWLGLTSAQRIGGLILGLHWVLCLTGLLLAEGRLPPLRQCARLLPPLLKAGLIALGVVWVFTPSAWPHPFYWLYEAAYATIHHANHGTSVLNGELIDSRNTPWYYLGEWFYTQTPLLWLALGALGFGLLIAHWERFSPLQRALTAMLLLQEFSMPLFSILTGSELYAGIRHFVFSLPPFAFCIGYALIWLLRQCRTLPRQLALAAAVGAYMASIAIDMGGLHPFEYDYRNELARSDANRRWHIDLNVNVQPEAAHWLNTNAPPGNVVVLTNYGEWLLQRYLRPDIHAYFWGAPKGQPADAKPVAVYAVAAAGGSVGLNFMDNCKVVQKIERHMTGQTIGFANIRRCQ